jgi:tellurite resistance protein TerC
VVETTDVIFAVDSIPAIFAITTDPFIVYTSNVFAILGLRALYFLLAGIMDMFRYLKVGLSFVLCFVGVKMLLVDLYKIPIGVSLGVVAGILAVSILFSLLERKPAGIPSPGIEPD